MDSWRVCGLLASLKVYLGLRLWFLGRDISCGRVWGRRCGRVSLVVWGKGCAIVGCAILRYGVDIAGNLPFELALSGCCFGCGYGGSVDASSNRHGRVGHGDVLMHFGCKCLRGGLRLEPVEYRPSYQYGHYHTCRRGATATLLPGHAAHGLCCLKLLALVFAILL